MLLVMCVCVCVCFSFPAGEELGTYLYERGPQASVQRCIKFKLGLAQA